MRRLFYFLRQLANVRHYSRSGGGGNGSFFFSHHNLHQLDRRWEWRHHKLLSAADVRRRRWRLRAVVLGGLSAAGVSYYFFYDKEKTPVQLVPPPVLSEGYLKPTTQQFAAVGSGGVGEAGASLPSTSSAVAEEILQYDMSSEVAQLIVFAKRTAADGDNATAADALEKALSKAEEQHISKRTLCGIHDKCANVYLSLRDYDKALHHFRAVLEEVVPKSPIAGAVPASTSPEAIEISLKMAACLCAQGKAPLADSGYRWCEQQAEQAVVMAAGQTAKLAEAYALCGMVHEEYALYLRSVNQHEDAHQHFQRAASIAETLGTMGEDYHVAQARAYYYASIESQDIGRRAQAHEEAQRAVHLCKSRGCNHLAVFEAQLREVEAAAAPLTAAAPSQARPNH